MDTLSTPARNFLNLHTDAPVMHWPYSPTGLYDVMRTNDLRFQMNYSISELEKDLLAEGAPSVLQLCFSDDEEWELFANGALIARGSQEFARSCFAQDAWEFKKVCREALAQARKEASRDDSPAGDAGAGLGANGVLRADGGAEIGAFGSLAALQLTTREYQLLCAAREICKVG